MLQAGPLISFSPSFNSYSSSGQNLADIAARVVSEFRRDVEDDAIYLYNDDQYDTALADDHDDDDDESEFEFAFVGQESASSPISADEIFDNGRIRAVYPLFGRRRDDDVDVKASGDGNDEAVIPPPPAAVRRRQPLRMLMVEEGFAASSCSSSETDELDGLKDGTYCVWRPGNNTGGEEKKKKSKSTGTVSRRWNFRGLLLHRSNTGDGKGDNNAGAPTTLLVAARKSPGGDSKRVADGKGTETGMEEDEKKKPTSFLPYKQDLVGFLANVNGLSRNLHPF